jgi:hypothetical protein
MLFLPENFNFLGLQPAEVRPNVYALAFTAGQG